MHKINSKVVISSLIGVSLQAAGLSALAQTNTLEEIIVTAQKREQSVQDVPIAIATLSATQLQLRQVQSLEDVAANIASLNYGKVANSGQMSIRGVGFGLFTATGENAVAFHRDGVYISAPAALPMVQNDIGFVEVLRGPQGTLWGRNATGGVVNVRSVSPSDDFEFGLSALAGNYSRERFFGHIGGPITNTLKGRISATTDDRDGYIENNTLGGSEDNLDSHSINLALDWEIGDSANVAFRAFDAKEKSGTPVFDPIDKADLIPLPPGTYDNQPDGVTANKPYDMTQKIKGGSLNIDYEINDNLLIKAITGYSKFSLDYNNDGDGTSLDFFSNDRGSSVKTWSQEINLVGTYDTMEWTVGLYYLDEKVALDGDTLLGTELASTGISKSTHIANETTESYAVYGDVTYHLNDDLRLLAGARYMVEDKEHVHSNLLTLATGTVIPVCSDNKQDRNDDKVTGRLGVQFDWTDNVMGYALVSNGFKSGGFGNSGCDQHYEPEELDAFEVGVKSTLMDERLRLNGAIYVYDYQNHQYEEVIGQSVFTRNADANIWGAELEFSALLMEDLELDVAVSYINAEYNDAQATDSLQPELGVQSLDGNPMVRSPEWSATAGLQYSFDLNDLGALVFRGDVVASDKYQLRQFDNALDSQDSYAQVNAYAKYTSASENWQLKMFVKNATDEYILGGHFDAGGYRVGSYGSPRTYGMEVTFNYR